MRTYVRDPRTARLGSEAIKRACGRGNVQQAKMAVRELPFMSLMNALALVVLRQGR